MSEFPIPTLLDLDLDAVDMTITQRLRARTLVEQIAGPFAQAPARSRVRAAIVLLSARLGQYEHEATIHAAAAIELIHAAAGLHVGLVDQAARRQDRVSAWAGLDGNVSLMVGDYLLALAADEMALAPDQRIIAFYSRAVMAFCEGSLVQVRDFDPATARSQYLESSGRATAALFDAAARAGAVCGGLTPDRVEALGRYGYALGLALRLGDDAVDLRDGPGATIRAGLITLPLIYAVAAGGSQLIKLIDAPPDDPAGLTAVLSEIYQRGGVERALADVRGYAGQALAELTGLPAGPVREALADLARYAARR